jgi:hypothetical protein
MRFTGLSHFIDLSVSPFNDIRFWLGSVNPLPAALAITVSDSKGNKSTYRYAFNNQGLLADFISHGSKLYLS